MPLALTIISALWRFLDGRGIGPTWARNVAGLAIALACAYVGLWTAPDGVMQMSALLWQLAVIPLCAVLAWITLIAGYTNWSSWSSLARYGLPACVIAVLGWVGGGEPIACALYALAGVSVGVLYTLLHRGPDFGWNTAICEAVAGAAIVGGISWL